MKVSFGSVLKLSQNPNQGEYNPDDLRKNFIGTIPEEDMDTFVRDVRRFNSYLKSDGDDKHIVSIEPVDDSTIRLVGSYGDMMESKRQDMLVYDVDNTFLTRMINLYESYIKR